MASSFVAIEIRRVGQASARRTEYARHLVIVGSFNRCPHWVGLADARPTLRRYSLVIVSSKFKIKFAIIVMAACWLMSSDWSRGDWPTARSLSASSRFD